MSETASPEGGHDPGPDVATSGAGPLQVAVADATSAKVRRRLARKHKALRRARKRGSLSMLLALGLVVAAAAIAALAAYVYWTTPVPNREVVAPSGTFVAPLAGQSPGRTVPGYQHG